MRSILMRLAAVAGFSLVLAGSALAQQGTARATGKKPNILAIWGDDAGECGTSAPMTAA